MEVSSGFMMVFYDMICEKIVEKRFKGKMPVPGKKFTATFWEYQEKGMTDYLINQLFQSPSTDAIYIFRRWRELQPETGLLHKEFDSKTLFHALQYLDFYVPEKSESWKRLHEGKKRNILYNAFIKRYVEEKTNDELLNESLIAEKNIDKPLQRVTSNLNKVVGIDNNEENYSLITSYNQNQSDQLFSKLRAEIEYLAANGQRQEFDEFEKNILLMLINYGDQLFQYYGYVPANKLINRELSSFISYEFKKWEKQLLLKFLTNPTTSDENRVKAIRIFVFKKILTDTEIVALLLDEKTFYLTVEHFTFLISETNNTPLLCISCMDIICKPCKYKITDSVFLILPYMDFKTVPSQLVRYSTFNFNFSGENLLFTLERFLDHYSAAEFTSEMIEKISEMVFLFISQCRVIVNSKEMATNQMQDKISSTVYKIQGYINKQRRKLKMDIIFMNFT